MNSHFTYFAILLASFAGPFVLSFDKKVAFYKTWKRLFPAMIFPAIFFILWDVVFTWLRVWNFNNEYISGNFLLNLPVEEVLFFLIVPYASVFIYECIRCYFPSIKNNTGAWAILRVIALLLLVTAVFFYDRKYTFWAFLLCGLYIEFIIAFKNNIFKNFNAALFLTSYAVILIPFLVVNGFLTAMPVVVYDNAETLGIRIFTIPFEDVFYGMLLILMVVAGYEKRRIV